MGRGPARTPGSTNYGRSSPMRAVATKRCYRCRMERPLEGFIGKRNGTTYSMCSTCLGNILSSPRPTKKARLVHTATERTCYLCRRVLRVKQFTHRSNGTYFSACKDCNVNVFSHRRRARLRESEGTFTTAEWDALKGRYPRCPDCDRLWRDIPVLPGKKSAITRDHIVAISKGGRNDISNLRPLCYSCNSRKGDR
jgi:5-methylcytosine-specific restriction endonuclease McrA